MDIVGWSYTYMDDIIEHSTCIGNDLRRASIYVLDTYSFRYNHRHLHTHNEMSSLVHVKQDVSGPVWLQNQSKCCARVEDPTTKCSL